MKKLLLILALFIGFSASSQGIYNKWVWLNAKTHLSFTSFGRYVPALDNSFSLNIALGPSFKIGGGYKLYYALGEDYSPNQSGIIAQAPFIRADWSGRTSVAPAGFYVGVELGVPMVWNRTRSYSYSISSGNTPVYLLNREIGVYGAFEVGYRLILYKNILLDCGASAGLSSFILNDEIFGDTAVSRVLLSQLFNLHVGVMIGLF